MSFFLKCKYCEHKFDGGVSRIKSHLAEVIDHDIVICKKTTKKKLIFLSKKKKSKENKKLI